MKRTIAAASLAFLLTSEEGIARAENECVGYGPMNAISIRPLAIASRGFAAQFEHFIAPPRFSLAIGPEVRFGASGDYSSQTYGLGAELRWWLNNQSIFGCVGHDAMVGPHFAARIDGSFTRLRDDVWNVTLGPSWTLSEKFLVGWRFTIDVIEITPNLGLLATTDFTGGLSPYTRYSIAWGLTTGILF